MMDTEVLPSLHFEMIMSPASARFFYITEGQICFKYFFPTVEIDKLSLGSSVYHFSTFGTIRPLPEDHLVQLKRL